MGVDTKRVPQFHVLFTSSPWHPLVEPGHCATHAPHNGSEVDVEPFSGLFGPWTDATAGAIGDPLTDLTSAQLDRFCWVADADHAP